LDREGVIAVPLERLTRFYLLRHCLLRKADRRDLVVVAGAVCGLHAQLPLTPYYSLWNRVKGFTTDQFDRALYREKSLVKTWFMRGTLHIIPSKDLPTYHHALKRMWFEHHGRYMNKPDWPPRELREKTIYPKIVEALAERPLRRKELNDRTRLLLGDAAQPYAKLFSAWGGILKETSYLGLTVYAEPQGKEARFARLNQWLPNVGLDSTDEAQARSELLLKYLQCYGPASPQDFACWSGLPASEATTIVKNNIEALQEVRVKETGKTLWLMSRDLRSLLKLDLEEEASPCLLPKYDPYLMGHKDRTRIIDPKHLQQVYRPVVGEVAATILVNGRITATWTPTKTKKTLMINARALAKIPKEAIAELEPAAEDLGRFMNVEHTEIRFTT
jgi:hypothetical protein